MGHFAKTLSREIKLNGYSQAVVSRLTGIPQCDVSDFCRGKRKPTAEKLEKLAKLFKVSVDYLTEPGTVDLAPPPVAAITPNQTQGHSELLEGIRQIFITEISGFIGNEETLEELNKLSPEKRELVKVMIKALKGT